LLFCSFGKLHLSLLLAVTLPNLVYPARTTRVEFLVSGSVWNSSEPFEFISAHVALQSLDFLAMAATWFPPENTATPAALASSDYVFSHSPRASGGRDGGTGLGLGDMAKILYHSIFFNGW
jgi:hypothetical protein